jgi:hypothetical protein
MKRYAGFAMLAAGWLLGGVGSASAAWDNVFQTCCHGCRSQSSSYFAPPAACCPTISYVQRCYYQPITCYRQETYCEPVTTYRTSYHWEPVTTYRYTSYYDPCTGCCQQVCTPCTSYRLRSQCNAVQSYVQRCRMVPYTSYRQSFYMEPVVTCAQPACPPDPCAAAGAAPSAPGAVPGISESPGGPPRMPSISEGPNRTLPPQNIPETGLKRAPASPPPIRFDRTTSLRVAASSLQGMVVREDRITPRGGTQLLFVSMEKQGPQQKVATDAAGWFDVSLPAGEWLLYVAGADGKPEYHSKLTVRASDERVVTVVSR